MAVRRRKAIRLHLKYMVWDKTLGHCWYCGGELDWGTTSYDRGPHLDHMLPLSCGGDDDVSNLVYACGRCNMQKNDCNVEEFRDKERDGLLRGLRHMLEAFVYLNAVQVPGRFDDLEVVARRLLDYCESVRVPFYGEVMEKEWDYYVI